MTVKIGALYYEYDEFGKLRKRRGKGFIKLWPDKDGYMKYALNQQSGTVNVIFHRLVWELFRGPIPTHMTVDHIDNDRSNNSIDNLQLLTVEENAVKGNARCWLAISPEGVEHRVYNLQQFCRDHNLNPSHMREVAHGKYWSKSQTYKGWKCYESNSWV